MAIEIERKFLLVPVDVAELINKSGYRYEIVYIEQFYLAVSEDSIERLRMVGDKFIHTTKSGFGLIREELESEISKDKYFKKREQFYDRLIQKRRFIVKCKKHLLEIDEFLGNLKGLVVLEVEFDSKKSSDNFKIPEFLEPYLVKEVTAYKEFTNGYLSRELKVPSLNEYKLRNIFDAISKKEHLKASLNIKLPPYQSIGNSIKVIAYSLALSIESNAKEILNGNKDIERVHQFRVASRKLRTLLKEFNDIFEPKWKEKRYKATREFISHTNLKRDTDIYLEDINSFKKSNLINGKDLMESLKAFIKDLNHKACKRSLKMIKSKKLQKEIEKFKNIEKFSEKADEPTVIALYRVLEKEKENIRQISSKLTLDSPDSDFHKLRVKLKKYRYTVEAFKSVIKGVNINTLLSELKKTQTLFGRFQDLTVQIELLVEFKKHNKNKKLLFSETDKLIDKLEDLKSQQKKEILEGLKKGFPF